MSEKAFADMMVAEMPYLRAFALSLSGSTTVADDLVQETLVKAWSHTESFSLGTNFRAWLVTILRNTYFNQYRKLAREVQDSDNTHAEKILVGGEQESRLTMQDVQRALNKLPEDHREILLMIGVTELSYEEAAQVCNIAVGTVKSRLNRARAKLAEHLGMVDGADHIDLETSSRNKS
jgi:RNA polymerase sigma-70 factor, ECF subfamily